jgi:uncharacterized protein
MSRATMTLHDATVPSFLQNLEAMQGILDRGLSHCRESGLDPAELVETRLAPDMHPLRFQVISVAHHSATALQGAMAGSFTGPPNLGPLDYPALQALIAEARAKVEAVTPEQLNGAADGVVNFPVRDRVMRFVAADFLLSFSVPNFYFHVSTSYAILRMKGVGLGKRDYLGKLRLKAD